MKTWHSAHEEERRAPARFGFARTAAIGTVASVLALASIVPALAGEHKSRGGDRGGKQSESGARVERGEKRGGAPANRGARVSNRDDRGSIHVDAPRRTSEPRRERGDDRWRDARDDRRDDRGSRERDDRYDRRDDNDKKKDQFGRHDWDRDRDRHDARADWRSRDDRRHARGPRDFRHVEKWSSNAEARFRASFRAGRPDCLVYRPVHRAPHRVVKWCDRRYYDYASLNVYLPRFWIDFVIVDSAPAGYLFYDPYCDEFFPTVSAFKAHMRYYGYSHAAALDVVWIGDVECDPWYVECSSGPSWSFGIRF